MTIAMTDTLTSSQLTPEFTPMSISMLPPTERISHSTNTTCRLTFTQPKDITLQCTTKPTMMGMVITSIMEIMATTSIQSIQDSHQLLGGQ